MSRRYNAIVKRAFTCILAAISLCISPQRYEGFGLVPLEAAASGTAVVATRVGAAATIVEDGKTGLLLEPNDPNAVTRAIERLLADPALRDRMSAAARRKALAEFDVSREVEGYLKVYRSLWAGDLAAESSGASAVALAPERDR